MAGDLQHFVPQLYLRYFIDDSQPGNGVWVYRRGDTKGQLRGIPVTAAQQNYYSFTLPDGRKCRAVDDALKKIEGLAAKILKAMIAGKRVFSLDEVQTWAFFLALTWTRVPKFRDDTQRTAERHINSFAKKLASDPIKFREAVQSFEAKTGRKLGDIDELRQVTLKTKFTPGSRFSLQMMFSDLAFKVEMLSAMIWNFRPVPEPYRAVHVRQPGDPFQPNGGGGRRTRPTRTRGAFPALPTPSLRRNLGRGARLWVAVCAAGFDYQCPRRPLLLQGGLLAQRKTGAAAFTERSNTRAAPGLETTAADRRGIRRRVCSTRGVSVR